MTRKSLLVLFSFLAFLAFAQAEEDICQLLRRRDFDLVVDNNMTYAFRLHQPGKNAPGMGPAEEAVPAGILGAWYAPPQLYKGFGRSLQEKSLLVTAEVDGREIPLLNRAEKSYFQPDHTYQEFEGQGIVLRQTTALIHDVILASFEFSNPGKRPVRLKFTGKASGLGRATALASGMFQFDIQEDFHQGLTEFIALDIPLENVTLGDEEMPPLKRAYQNDDPLTKGTFVHGTSDILSGEAGARFAAAIVIGPDAEEAKGRLQAALSDPRCHFADAHEKWRRFFTEDVPAFQCSDRLLRKFYYWSFYVFRANMFEKDASHIAYVCPSKYVDWLPLFWDEDTCHIITGARWFNSPRMLRLIQEQLLHFCRENSPNNYGLSTLAGWELYKRTQDADFRQELFRRTRARNLAYVGKMSGDMVTQKSSFELGWDNSIRYRWGGFNTKMRDFERPVITVDLNSYLVKEYELLARMSRLDGDSAASAELLAKADALKEKINRLLWDDETGFYYDIFADDHAKLMIQPCSGFFPLFAGIPSREQAERLFRLLLDPAKFNTRFAVPTIATDTEGVGHMWSGDVYARNNWLIAMGCAQYSQNLTKHLTEKTIALFLQTGEPCAVGNPDPHKGGGWPRLFSTEIAAGLDLFVKHYVGFAPAEDGAIEIFPAALPPDTEMLRWGPFHFHGREICVAYDREQGYRVTADGQELYRSQTPPDTPQRLALPEK